MNGGDQIWKSLDIYWIVAHFLKLEREHLRKRVCLLSLTLLSYSTPKEEHWSDGQVFFDSLPYFFSNWWST